MRSPAVLLALTLSALASVPDPACACGPFLPQCWFTFTKHPDLALEQFAAGDLGVLQPGWARSYKVVAYRHLAGIGLDASQQADVVALWRRRLGDVARPASEPHDALAEWIRVRSRVADAGPAREITRWIEDPSSWSATPNCRDDAFLVAARTLEDRLARVGGADPATLAWTRAQDAVFDNCDGSGAVPEPLPPDAPAVERADRAYQVAASLMYRGEHDAARVAFLALSEDSAFSRRGSARYLAARCLVRKALWTTDRKPEDLAAAAAALRTLLADEEQAPLHADASRLLELVRLRHEPGDALRDAAAACASPQAPALGNALDRLTWLLDAGVRAEGIDLLDWVLTWELPAAEASARALRRWNETRTVPWLVASLQLATPQAPEVPALLEAAGGIPETSAARPGAVLGAARLALASGRREQAFGLLDGALGSNLPQGSRNALLAARLPLIADEVMWWAAAGRMPAACGVDDTERELPWRWEQPACEPPLLDRDAAAVVAHGLTTSRLVRAAEMTTIARNAPLRRRLALAAWTRAILLDDDANARRAMAVAVRLTPEMTPHLGPWNAEPDPAARRFVGALVILRLPGLRPEVEPGFPRTAPLHERDMLRDNWWCESPAPPAWGDAPQERAGSRLGQPPAFLDEAEAGLARQESERLWGLGAAPVALGDIVIAWAREHADDPRVPEALHRVVVATRYGCVGPRNSEVSKAAFDMLHQRHPTSPWTRKTRYWY